MSRSELATFAFGPNSYLVPGNWVGRFEAVDAISNGKVLASKALHDEAGTVSGSGLQRKRNLASSTEFDTLTFDLGNIPSKPGITGNYRLCYCRQSDLSVASASQLCKDSRKYFQPAQLLLMRDASLDNDRGLADYYPADSDNIDSAGAYFTDGTQVVRRRYCAQGQSCEIYLESGIFSKPDRVGFFSKTVNDLEAVESKLRGKSISPESLWTFSTSTTVGESVARVAANFCGNEQVPSVDVLEGRYVKSPSVSAANRAISAAEIEASPNMVSSVSRKFTRYLQHDESSTISAVVTRNFTESDAPTDEWNFFSKFALEQDNGAALTTSSKFTTARSSYHLPEPGIYAICYCSEGEGLNDCDQQLQHPFVKFLGLVTVVFWLRLSGWWICSSSSSSRQIGC